MMNLQEHINLAASYLRQNIDSEHYYLAYLGGSVAYGLEHAFSDVDIYLVDRSTERFAEATVNYHGVPVQVNHIPESLFVEIENIANPHHFPQHDWRSIKASDDMIKMCTFAISGPTIDGRQTYLQRRSRLDWDHFNRYVMSRGAVLISRELEDCAGALLTEQIDTAWLACRSAVSLSLSVSLAAVRDFYPSSKFHLSILKGHNELNSIESPVRAALDAPAPSGVKRHDATQTLQPNDMQHEIRRRAALASYLTSQMLLHGWTSRLQNINCPNWRDHGLRRNPFYCVQRFGDTQIGIAGCDKGIRVGKTLAQEWLSLDLTSHPLRTSLGSRFPLEKLIELDVVLK